MSKKLQSKQKGFTLVELSIVLVIIGLIISSVLVGQDLVRSAELRSVVTQYESFNAAIGTFRGKYNGIPGDIDGNADFGFVGDGDGDGLLAPAGTAAGAGHDVGENVYFWNHLGSTGAALISGSYDGVAITDATTLADGVPATKVGEYWGVFEYNGINYFAMGVTTPNANEDQTTVEILSPIDAKNIDDKIDDGTPGRGIVQARGPHNTNPNSGTNTSASGNCVSADNSGTDADLDNPVLPTTAATYSTTVDSNTCTLRIRFNL